MTAPDETLPNHRPINRDRGVWPTSGPIAGGTTVTVTGSDLIGTSAVTFGGIPGMSITVVNPTTVSVVTPAKSAGVVDVVLTTPGGSVSAAEAYTFVAVPTLISVMTSTGLSSGPVIGGTLVTITGTNLTDISTLTFGGTPGTSITNVSATSVTVVTPAKSAGVVDVVLSTPGGSVSAIGAYTYVDAPTMVRVSPSSGPVAGKSTVTITGTNLTGTSTVTFGGSQGKAISVASATSVTVVTPAKKAGVVDVVLTTPAGGSVTLAGAYTFVELPTISKITPSAGPVAGGTTLTITGTNLNNASAITFGGTAAASITVNSPTTVTVVTPTHTPGSANVELVTPGGSVIAGDEFTFVGAPTISRVVKAAGPVAGGTVVTISGANLSNTSQVTFGGVAGTSLKVASSTSVTVVTPAMTAGAVDVVLTTPAGGTATSADAFTFVNAPTITKVVPSAGRTIGQGTVTITGMSLTDTASVTFGGVAGTSLNVVNANSVTVVAPSHAAGAVDVVLTTPAGGAVTLAGGYTYVNAPTISKVAPSAGPVAGGTLVTITGTTLTAASEVTFGGTPGTALTVASPTSVTVLTPARASAVVKVMLTTPAGGSVTVAGAFQFVDLPTISAVSSLSGPVSGRATLTLTGKNLTDTSSVTFAGTPATSITKVSDTSVTVVTPEKFAGTVDLVLTTRDGGAVTVAEAYTFVDAPTITKVSRSSGPVAGRSTLTITGTNLADTSAVSFGSSDAASFTVISPTSVTVVTPAKTAGAIDVVLTTPGGSATLVAAYTFVDPPTIASLVASSGPVSGGTTVTIMGTTLTDTTAVTFGGTAATAITNESANSITVVTPAKPAGSVDVVLTTPGGGSITISAAYTFVNPPTITEVSPLIGPSVGRSKVTISGSNLTDASSVTFGGTPGTSIAVESDSTVTVISPPRAAGVADVSITTPAGGSAISIGAYTFVNAPTISRVAPSAGPVVGGTKVTITGTNLTGTSAVTFGGTAGTSIAVVSATSVTVMTPAKPAGLVDVVLVTPGGSISSADAYTFVKAPTIAGPPPETPAIVEAPIVLPPPVEEPTANDVPVVPEIIEPEIIEPKLVVQPPPPPVVAEAKIEVARVAPVVPVVPIVVPKVEVPKVEVSKVVAPKVEVVVAKKVISEVAKPSESTPTQAQEFIKKARGAFGRLIQPPKVDKTPKAKVVAPKPKPSASQTNREFVLLVHAPESKTPAVEPIASTVPKKKNSAKESSISDFVGKGRSAIGKWARNLKVDAGSAPIELVPEKSLVDQIPPIPVVESDPPAPEIVTPPNPAPKHGVSAMNNDGAKTPFKPSFLKMASILELVDKTRDSIKRRVRKPELDQIPAVPTAHLGLSTIDEIATTQPIEPNFFALAAIHESVDKARDTIGRRVRKSVIAVIGLLIIVASIDGYAVSVVTRQSNRLESEYREMIAANQSVLVSAVASDLAIRSFLLSGDRSYLEKFEVARPQLVDAIADLKRVAVKVGDQGLLQLADNSAAIVQLWLRTFVDRTMVIASADTPRGDQLAGAELINNLRGASISIADYIADVNDKAVVVASRVRRQTIAIAALVLVVAFLVIAVLLILGGSDISFPLINLSHVVNRIYRGENKARADDTAGPAEIRAVSRAVNELAYQQETAHEWVTQFNLSKSNFLNTVNHELRTPLTSITGYSELLGEDNQLTHTERNRMATIINRNAFRLNDLIDNMLTVLRIDSMEVRFKMSTFDIRNVIDESIEGFRALADSREQTIVADLGDEPFTVWADENEILRVVSNLISNALKFSNSGGQINVSARSVEASSGKREVAVAVSDTGIGIVDAELQHVGSRFYRSSNAIAAAIPGTGIGLMIVGFIVHEHGGSWSLVSTENGGTRAEIRLPLALASIASAHAVGPPPVVGN